MDEGEFNVRGRPLIIPLGDGRFTVEVTVLWVKRGAMGVGPEGRH